MYNMPLASLLGTNHHRHTIVFGIALLRNESSGNFYWLFNTWLKVMYDKHSKTIITDQDKAMKKAIELFFLAQSIGVINGIL
jgi:MULE transposase domain